MPTQPPRSRKAAAEHVPLADRYRVLARVGLGGTAVVYRCVDLHTERIVAVKVLRTNGPLIPEAAARFRREAHLVASFSHPHVVRVLDYGYTVPLAATPLVAWAEETEQPVPYLAMEYVFGSTLKQLLRQRGPLPLEWVWRIGEQLCAALAMAHSFGVVHRDVKPQNVMIVDSRVELLTKLTDFGIARQVGGDLTTLTATGQVLGTPDYLSPEQVLGEPGGPSADIYSLGIVLYELVTARLPFEADTPLAAASRRMVADPPPPTAYRRDVPWPLQEVILLALRRAATDRYPNALEFAQALRWSRERSPAVPPAPPGTWVLDPRPSGSPKSHPAEPARVASDAERSAESFEEQSTVLRVVPTVPGLEDDPARLSAATGPQAPVVPNPPEPDTSLAPDASLPPENEAGAAEESS